MLFYQILTTVLFDDLIVCGDFNIVKSNGEKKKYRLLKCTSLQQILNWGSMNTNINKYLRFEHLYRPFKQFLLLLITTEICKASTKLWKTELAHKFSMSLNKNLQRMR